MGSLSNTRTTRVKRSPALTLSLDGYGEFIESERQRLAQEIHDGLIQELTGAVLQLEICTKVYATDSSQVLPPLTRAKVQARKCLQQLRPRTCDRRLTAGKELGWVQALRQYCDELSQETGVAIDFKVTKVQVDVALPIARSVFCIVREALLNVTKHAKAERIQVNLGFDQHQLIVTLKDDGVGFDVKSTLARAEEEKKFGIVGMGERAHLLGGTLHVQSSAESGTEVTAIIPYTPPRRQAR